MADPGPEAPPPPRVGISSCLLGERVRHDGGHKLALDLVSDLGQAVEWVPVCPELEVGMGVPREPVNLIAASMGAAPRMVAVESGRDWTDAMESLAERRLDELARLGISGYVLKSRSPSCGLEVPLRSPTGERLGDGAGLFAAALRRRFPGLPIAGEDQLVDPASRRGFIARVIRYRDGRRDEISRPPPPLPK
jgi:uncharacterized protein YbbK (DUF523 family)